MPAKISSLPRLPAIFLVPKHLRRRVVQSFVDMEVPEAGRAACVHTTGRERSEREHGVPFNQTSNRGACRANEIHRSTQLTNCPAAPPFTPPCFSLLIVL